MTCLEHPEYIYITWVTEDVNLWYERLRDARVLQEELARIFERFYRGDRSRSAHGSFGLGLPIAEGIAMEHGGKIWAESERESGNRFFVSLPLG